MGDHTYASITVYDAPVEAVEEINDLLADEGLIGDYYQSPDVTQFEFDVDYSADEVGLGMVVDTIAYRLIELGATFECSEDAKYEYPGEMVIHIPAIGTFRGRLAGETGPVLTRTEIVAILDRAVGLSDAREQIEREFGTPWFQALEPLRERTAAKSRPTGT